MTTLIKYFAVKNVFTFIGLECSMKLWMHMQSRGKNVSETLDF